MVKKLNLYASTIGVFAHAISIIMFIASILGCSMEKDTYFGVFCGIFLALAVAGFVLNLVTMGLSGVGNEKYKRRKGLVITSTILNLMVMYVLFTENYSYHLLINVAQAWSVVLYVINFITLFAFAISAFVYLVDLIKSTQASKVENAVETVEGEEETDADEAVQQSAQADVELKLEQLKKMHDHGLIDDAEYAEIKEKYVKELIK